MRLISIHIFKWKSEDAKLWCSEMNLTDLWFYQRGIAKDLINFNAMTIAGRIPKGNKGSITLENDVGRCHCWVTKDGIAATAMTCNDYPERAAYTLLNKIIFDFGDKFNGTDVLTKDPTPGKQLEFPELEVYLRDWQNPHEADKLLKIEKELEEVSTIVHKNLKDLLERGEAMEELMDKSETLNQASVAFYKQAKKNNTRCCNVA